MLGLLLLQTGKISLQTFAYDWNETLPAPQMTPTAGFFYSLAFLPLIANTKPGFHELVSLWITDLFMSTPGFTRSAFLRFEEFLHAHEHVTCHEPEQGYFEATCRRPACEALSTRNISKILNLSQVRIPSWRATMIIIQTKIAPRGNRGFKPIFLAGEDENNN